MADPTTSAGEAPMYVPPNSAPVLQSLIAESAKLGHWALHEQLCGVLASVDAERRRHAEEVAALRGQLGRFERARHDLDRLVQYVLENEDVENPSDVAALMSAGIVEHLLAVLNQEAPGDRRNNPRRGGRHQKVRRMMSETRRIKAPDGWTLLVRNSGSIEAQIADVWVWLDEGGGLAVESDEANHGLCIPAEVVRAVLNQTMPLPAELIDGEWEFGGSEGEPDASVTYTEEPYPETGHVGWCWWAHGKMGDAESLVGAMGAAEAALKAEAPGG